MSGYVDHSSSLAGLLTVTPAGVIAVGIIMPLSSCIAVGLRFYARRWQQLGIEADDWTMLASTLLVGFMGLILIVGSAIGALGLHSDPANPGSRKGNTIDQGPADAKAEQILHAYSIVEKPAFALIKISIVLLYRRIFRDPIWRLITVISIIFLSLMAIAFIITSALQCDKRNWGIWYAGWALRNHCVSAELSTFGFAIVDVLTDLVIVLMPLPFVWGLQMSIRRRVTVFCVFVLACSSIAVGIIRQAVITIFTFYGNKGYRDLLGVMTIVPTMSIIEAGIAIVAACMPTFRHLITNKFLRLGTDNNTSKRSEHTPEGTGRMAFAMSRNGRKEGAKQSLEFDNLLHGKSTQDDIVARQGSEVEI